LRGFGDETFIEATQTGQFALHWRQSPVSYSLPVQVEKRCSKLFVNALNETGGNPSQAAEGLKMSLLNLKMAIKKLGIG
jgi:ribose 1,5-bisphosphokinase PhnN